MARKSYAILGTGRFGNHLAGILAENGQDVIVVDDDQDKLQAVQNVVTKAIIGDITDENILTEIGIRNFDVIVIGSAQDLERNLMAATLCKELGCKYVIAKAATELHGKMLNKLGVDRVIYPDYDIARRLGRSLLSRSLLDYISVSEDFSILEMTVTKELVGKTIAELKLRDRFGVNVVLMKNDNEVKVPESTMRLQKDGILVVMGRNEDLEKFEKAYNKGDSR